MNINVKGRLAHTFAAIPKAVKSEDTKLIIVTAAGTIFGEPVVTPKGDYDTKNGVTPEWYAYIASQCTKSCKESTELELSSDPNDEYIPLKNVTIKSGNSSLTSPFLCVFVDQIIAITTGTNPSI